MIYMQCRCGELQTWTSGMPVPRCCPCVKCGSVPGVSPQHHPDPIDHEFVAEPVETDEGGATLSRCRHCHMTRAQLAKRAERIAAQKE